MVGNPAWPREVSRGFSLIVENSPSIRWPWTWETVLVPSLVEASSEVWNALTAKVYGCGGGDAACDATVE